MFFVLEPYLFRQLKGHKDAITCISFSPTGKQIATGSLDATIILYHLNDKKRTYKFQGHQKAVTDLTFSNMGKYMASSSEDSTVRLWVPTLTGSTGTFRPHTESVRSVQYCPDESKIITASDDKTVKLTSGSSLKFIRSFVGHTNSVRCARVTNDGAIVASCSDDKTIKIWDIDDGKCFHTFKTDRQRTFVAWHPSNLYVAAASRDGQIQLYDIRTYKLLQSYSVHLASVNQIALHPDGKHLLSASSDGTMKLIDLSEGHPVFTVKPGGRINAVSFSRNGDSFASAGDSKMLGIWKMSEELSENKQRSISESIRSGDAVHYDSKKDRSVWYKCYHNMRMPSATFEHVLSENYSADESAAFSQNPNANSTEINGSVREEIVDEETLGSRHQSQVDENVGHSSHIPRTPPTQATYSIPSILNDSVSKDRQNIFGMIRLKENDVCYTSGTIEWVGRKRSFPINSGFKIVNENRVQEPMLKRAKTYDNASAMDKGKECDCADVLPTVNAIVDHLNALHEAVDLVDLRVNTLEDALSKDT